MKTIYRRLLHCAGLGPGILLGLAILWGKAEAAPAESEAAGGLKGLTILQDTVFPGDRLPPGWAVTGSAWPISNGAHSPAAGGFDSILYYNAGGAGASTLDRETIEAQVRLADVRSVFALCTQGAYGTIAEVDGEKKVLRYYLSWKGGRPTGELGTVNIPFELKAGGDYAVRLEKTLGTDREGTRHLYRFSLTDLANGKNVVQAAFFRGGIIPWPGHMWGAPGVMFRQGRIEVRRFAYGTPFPLHPVLWVGGDSFVEGDSIFASKDRRFAQLLLEKLQGNAVISGGGGATSGDLLARLPLDLAPFKPDYCLVLIGANDRNFAEWRDNVAKIVQFVRQRGAQPLLGTLAPRADRQQFLNQANAWIIASGIAYVDLAAALTQDRDRVTWNPAYMMPDGVHPNLAGHAAIVEEIRRSAPDPLRSKL